MVDDRGGGGLKFQIWGDVFFERSLIPDRKPCLSVTFLNLLNMCKKNI